MKTKYTVTEDGMTLISERTFAAPVEKVWEAWTTQELLEQWWAPLPYKAVTRDFNFSEGGRWFYSMQGPEGDVHWCLNNYVSIVPGSYFTADDAFCDEEGNENTELPVSSWRVEFKGGEFETTVTVTTTYAKKEGLDTVIEMGMKEGFDMGLNQLEALLLQ